MVTFWAPPHWEFLTVEPSDEHELRCLQTEPSDMPYWNSRSQENSVVMSMVSTEKAEISELELEP